jgi:hypothetical protein
MFNSRKILTNFTFISAFFPSTLYFLFPGNQVQPMYLVGAAPLLFFGIKRTNISNSIYLILILILIFVFISSLASNIEISTILINGLSYIAPLIGFLSIYTNVNYLSSRALKFTIFLWSIVGCIQYFDIFYLLKPIIASIGKFMIAERFEAFRVVDGADGRGVSFLMAEPAGSAIVIITMIASLIFFRNNLKISKNDFLIYTLLCIVMMYLNASGTMLILFILFLLGLIINTRYGIRIILLILISVIIITFLIRISKFSFSVDNRLIMLILYTIDYVFDIEEMKSLKDFIVSIVGLRFFNTIYSYGSIINNYGLGNGIAGWSDWQIREEIMTILDFDSLLAGNQYIDISGEMKPWSYFSILIFDCGIFGVAAITYLLVRIFRIVRKRREWCYLLPMLVILFFFPPVTLLAPWLLLIYTININRIKNE